MAKSKGALTNAQIEAFKGGAKYQSGKHKGKQKPQDFLWCSKEGGFGIRLGMKTGVRTFILQYRMKGAYTDRVLTIGRYDSFTTIEEEQKDGTTIEKDVRLDVIVARELAQKWKNKMRRGIDPIAKPRQEKDNDKPTTLRQVLEHFLTHHRTKHGKLRPRTEADYRNYVGSLPWQDEPVAGITRGMCLEVYTKKSDHAPQSANLTFEYLRAVLNHARELHFNENTGEYSVLPHNPVTLMFKLRKKKPSKARDRRIPLDKIGEVWLEIEKRRAAARTIDQRTAVDWVAFMLLTGCRLTESASLKWSDIDLDHKTFTMGEDVAKNHNEVTLPLNSLLHEILSARVEPVENEKAAKRRRVKRVSDYVFPSNGQKCPHIASAPATFDAITKIAGLRISPHDLRRTYEDIATEVKVDSDQRRLLINHISGDVHAVHYANNRKALQAASEAIAAYIRNAAKVTAGANVVPLPTAAQREARGAAG